MPAERRPETGTAAARAALAGNKDALAEHVVEGGSIGAFARAAGRPESWGYWLWARVREDMGPQAQ